MEHTIGGDGLLKFQCEICYQGEDFEDPEGWNEEELKEFRAQYDKENKKKKKGEPESEPFEDFLPVKMKTPELVQVTQESGRLFKIQMVQKLEEGKLKYFKVDYRQDLEDVR